MGQVNFSSGAVSYLVADALGSLRGALSASGTLTASTSYDAYGNPESSGGLSAYTPFGFAGGYTDPAGVIYLIGRYHQQYLAEHKWVLRFGRHRCATKYPIGLVPHRASPVGRSCILAVTLYGSSDGC